MVSLLARRAGGVPMLNWQTLFQGLLGVINALVCFAKTRRREQAAIGFAAFLLWLGHSHRLVRELTAGLH
jgi:hypothetical protein